MSNTCVKTSHSILEMDRFDYDFETTLYTLSSEAIDNYYSKLSEKKTYMPLSETETAVLDYCIWMLERSEPTIEEIEERNYYHSYDGCEFDTSEDDSVEEDFEEEFEEDFDEED